jgi:hypothetical protein
MSDRTIPLSVLNGMMEARLLQQHEEQLKPELSGDIWKNRSNAFT